jgi:hypothetical protein
MHVPYVVGGGSILIKHDGGKGEGWDSCADFALRHHTCQAPQAAYVCAGTHLNVHTYTHRPRTTHIQPHIHTSHHSHKHLHTTHPHTIIHMCTLQDWHPITALLKRVVADHGFGQQGLHAGAELCTLLAHTHIYTHIHTHLHTRTHTHTHTRARERAQACDWQRGKQGCTSGRQDKTGKARKSTSPLLCCR